MLVQYGVKSGMVYAMKFEDEIGRRLIRCFLGVGKNVLFHQWKVVWAGHLDPYVRHEVETVRMWCHLCLLPPTPCIWLGLQTSTTRNEHVDKNAGAILQDCGLEALQNTWLLTSSKMWVVDMAITKQTDTYIRAAVEINNMPKLRTYRELKSTFTCENYVKCYSWVREAAYLDYAPECSLWSSRQAVGVENRSKSVRVQFAHNPSRDWRAFPAELPRI